MTGKSQDVLGRLSLAPAFGQANLSNCELEQIHLSGSIQPVGALLLVSEPDHVILQASADAAEFLGLRGSIVGLNLAAVPGNLAASIRPHLDTPMNTLPLVLRCRVGRPPVEMDGLLHRPPGGGLVIELEHAGPPVDLSAQAEAGLKTILDAAALRPLCREAARLFRDITGYDRVMVYSFDQDGHGEVIAEERRDELEAFLGNRYPASDIPQMARRLYERNRIRVLVDVGYVPEPLVSSPTTGRQLDMSLCFLRSISPIHVQYLKNMGVAATLVVSIMVGGRLWGLVSCHHYAARRVQFEIRAVCELLAEALGTRIMALESFAEGQAALSVRRLEQRMIEAISRQGDWRSALFDSDQAVLRPLDATGAALLFEGEVLSAGEVPGTQQLRDIAAWLDRQPPRPVQAAVSLGLDVPQFAPLIPMASGIVAVRVSDTPGEYLIWCRPEQVRTVTWGGDPRKAVVVGDDPMDLSPRRSFAQWHQSVEGTCEPWSVADLTAARMIGDTVTDVVLQFRAVRTLVAEDQLEQVRGQVGRADQAVVIGNAQGQVILANDAFRRMLAGAAMPHRIDEFAAGCADDASRHRLADLIIRRRLFRGEITLVTGAGERVAVMLRADPVISSPDRLLGFVLLFTDLAARHAGDAARREFQDGIRTGQRLGGGPIAANADTMFQSLLSSIVENAQLAAMEITDGVDLTRMPGLLDSVRASVARATEVLEHLTRHAAPRS